MCAALLDPLVVLFGKDRAPVGRGSAASGFDRLQVPHCDQAIRGEGFPVELDIAHRGARCTMRGRNTGTTAPTWQPCHPPRGRSLRRPLKARALGGCAARWARSTATGAASRADRRRPLAVFGGTKCSSLPRSTSAWRTDAVARSSPCG